MRRRFWYVELGRDVTACSWLYLFPSTVRLIPSFIHVMKVAAETVDMHSRAKLSFEGKQRKVITLGGAAEQK